MKRFLAVVKVELLRHIRSPFLLSLMIAVPIAIAVLGIYFTPGSELRFLKLAFYNEDNSYLGRYLVDFVSSFLRWENVLKFDNLDSFYDSLESGEADAGIIVPKGFAAKILFKQPSEIVFVAGLDDPQLSVALYQTLNSVLNELGASPLFTEPELLKSVEPDPTIKPPELKLVIPSDNNNDGKTPDLKDLVFPGIAIASAVLISLISIAGSFGEDREEGGLDGVLVSPISPWVYALGKYSAHVFLGMVEVVAIFTFAAILGVQYSGNLFKMLFFSFLVVCMTVSIGMILSIMFRSRRSSVFMATSVGAVLLLGSGAFVPLSALPDKLREILGFFPLTLAVKVVKQLALVDMNFRNLMTPLIFMTLSTLALLLASFVAFHVVSRYFN
ncbi:MAG: type transport system permease protein [Thermotogota bacterium]|nr:type transport system permease protein [Thermotogota bacterium]MDK2865525.1 type transport system permease protein [Thermotogota bacterium]HCZ06759.1 hypothetical protein [Thermotogota bacterium]